MILSCKDFGVKPDTPSQQCGIQEAIDFCSKNGHTLMDNLRYGETYLTDYPIYQRSGLNWMGNAPVRNINPNGGIDSTTFLAGGFHPAHFKPSSSTVGAYTHSLLEQITEPNKVELIDDEPELKVGDLVYICSNDAWQGKAGEYPVYGHSSVVEAVNGKEVTIADPFCDDMSQGQYTICNAEQEGITDILGNQLEFCKGARIDGLSFISDHGNVMARGGMYRCDFNFNLLQGVNGVFSNGFNYTNVNVNRLISKRKMVDIAGLSHNSNIHINESAYIYEQGVSENISYCRVGESSRDINVTVNRTNCAGFAHTQPIIAINSGSKRVRQIHNDLYAPDHKASPIKISQADNEEGTQQILDNCSVSVKGRIGKDVSRGAFIDAKDDDNIVNCGFERLELEFEGTPRTGNAVELGGRTPYIKSAHCDKGRVRLPTDITNAFVRGYFADGASVVTQPNDVEIG